MPNPANDRVIVSVEVEKPSSVDVDLLNVAGEQVIEPLRTFVVPGSASRISLTTSNIPQGVYTLRAIANGVATMKTVVIAR